MQCITEHFALKKSDRSHLEHDRNDSALLSAQRIVYSEAPQMIFGSFRKTSKK